jgi:hypothetical protein
MTLIWTAPEVSEATTVYLFATTEFGETTGECAVNVTPLSVSEAGVSDDESSVDDNPSVDEVAAAGIEEPGSETSEARQQESNSDDESKDAGKPTEIVNEVWRLPTPGMEEPDEDGDEEDGEPSPTPTVNLTPTVRPTATIAPTTSEDGSVASLVGPSGGTLSSPLGATLIVPEGALTEISTVSIQPVSDTKLPVQNQVDLVANSAFDITIAGPDGRAIESISEPAELRIEIDEDEMREGMQVYRVDGSELTPLNNTRIEENSLVFTFDEFSRFVAGVPTPTEPGSSRSLVPFALAAGVVVLVMLGMVVLGGMFRPRRQRVVTTRRPPSQRSRYR